MTDLLERLRSWAQNEEMIDQYYTDHGVDCNEAADEIERLKAELQLTRGAMVADDERLRAAAVKAGVTDFGCDTADHLADRILELQSVVDAARKAMNSGNPLDDVELRFAIRAYDEGRNG